MDQFPTSLPPAAGAPAPAPPPAGQTPPLALTLDQRVAQIKALIDAGYAGQIMLSNDWSLAMPIQPTANDRFRRAQNPDGILLVIRKVIPRLKQMGVSDAAIHTMTVEAPRRFFEGA
jgi:predicted metal-dependent phosphotriesterase family hydrolase